MPMGARSAVGRSSLECGDVVVELKSEIRVVPCGARRHGPWRGRVAVGPRVSLYAGISIGIRNFGNYGKTLRSHVNIQYAIQFLWSMHIHMWYHHVPRRLGPGARRGANMQVVQ